MARVVRLVIYDFYRDADLEAQLEQERPDGLETVSPNNYIRTQTLPNALLRGLIDYVEMLDGSVHSSLVR